MLFFCAWVAWANPLQQGHHQKSVCCFLDKERQYLAATLLSVVILSLFQESPKLLEQNAYGTNLQSSP
jgi:hypothetical protein